MNYSEAVKKLQSIDQIHLLQFWDQLNPEQKQELLKDIQALDLAFFQKQKAQLAENKNHSTYSIEPFNEYATSGNKEDFYLGQDMLSKGKMGCLIVAGGQGTRLGFDGPKGMVPVSLIKHKTLFQIFSEKTLAASKQHHRDLFLAIMTSPLNHQTTIDYFEKNHYFGLKKSQLAFFSQGMLPFIDKEGNLFLESVCSIAKGPNGNGLALHHFWKSGIGPQWAEKGIEYINFIQIDNPLANPFDEELLGYHHRGHLDITLKSVLRQDAHEKVGILIKQSQKIRVIEYSEISETERLAKDEQGSLKHPCANLSLFCFSMNFIQHVAKTDRLPLHLAYKSAQKFISPQEPVHEMKAWKYEYFIFDILAEAKKISALVYPRELCFAPLKNSQGEHTLATVQEALQKLDRMTLEKLTGKNPPSLPFELSQDFYYPTPELLAKWKGRSPPSQSYIEA